MSLIDDMAVKHALQSAKSVRSKLGKKGVNTEVLLLELKEAHDRLHKLLAEIQGTTPMTDQLTRIIPAMEFGEQRNRRIG